MSKKFYTFVAILATTFAGIVPVMAQQSGPVNDTIYMGANYANEVYYSMANGTKGAVARDKWDIAFRASSQSASIITNDGSGVELYSYPKSTKAGWATVDTSGLYTWTKMVNSTNDWEDGAFDRNQKGGLDYGWGSYNMATHYVTGDSIFIIKLRDGSFRKLMIVKKLSSLNTFEFQYANLDGSSDTPVSLDCSPYSTKNFIGYSLITNEAVDFEPAASAQWDLLFTKYMYTYPPTTPQAGTLYGVTGVLSNYKVKVKKYTEVVTGFPAIDPKSMDSTRAVIGHDWKSFNGAGFVLVDPLVYFVQDKSGKIYKLIFRNFAGASTGRIAFTKEAFSTTGIEEIEANGFNAVVYPNPVSEVMNLAINPGKSKSVVITLLDLSGRTVLSKKYDLQSEDLSTLKIPVAGFPSGIYMMKIQNGSNVISRKVVVNN